MRRPDLDVLLNEIHEQPAIVERLLSHDAPVAQLADEIRRRQPVAIVMVARGSSDNAAVYGRYLFEICNQRLTSLAAPSGLTLYGSGPRLDNTVVIGVSQSGQGEDVVSYVRHARAQGALTAAIVNDEASPLVEAAELVLACRAGAELSVPATKTVTAQMTLLALLSLHLEGRGADALKGLPHALESALACRAAASHMAAALASTTVGSVVGRGFAFPPALEIALKLKETSYTRAEPFSAADFLHGPLALVESTYGALLVDVGGRSSEAAREIAAAVHARGGQPFFLRAGEITRQLEAPDSSTRPDPRERQAHVSSAPDASGARDATAPGAPELTLNVPIAEPFAPIVVLILGQLLVVELALARGVNPARPRGLRKVTSTR